MHTKELPDPGLHFLGPTLGHRCPSASQLTWDFIFGVTPLFDIKFSKLATLSTFEYLTPFPVGCKCPLSSGQVGACQLVNAVAPAFMHQGFCFNT